MLEVIIMFIADIIVKLSAFPFKLLEYADNVTELFKGTIKSVFNEIQNTGEWTFTVRIAKKNAIKIESTMPASDSKIENDQALPRTD